MPDTKRADPGLFEVIHTTRSMRRLKPGPVPDALIARIIEAGLAAPSGGNMQRWRFLVVKDATVKQRVAFYYKRAFNEHAAPRYQAAMPAPGMSADRYSRMLAAFQHLADHIREAPVWIVPCIEEPPDETKRWSGSSIYPAVQNMLLAARGLGLGATLTTLHLIFATETEAILALPPSARSYAILPIGYPMGRFGPVGRAPLEEVAYVDRWGEPYLKK